MCIIECFIGLFSEYLEEKRDMLLVFTMTRMNLKDIKFNKRSLAQQSA